MFNSETVFVIGAGASYEFGFPLGAGLAKLIAQKLDIRYDIHDKASGDERIVAAHRVLASRGVFDVNQLRQASQRIRDGVVVAPSIDTFLGNHIDDFAMQWAGKLAIARCILEKESNCVLRARESPPALRDDVVQSSWYTSFFYHLTDDTEFERLFNNVSFIIFNYDRSFETYLFHALQARYVKSADTVAKLLNRARFIHPYGTVGTLPWQGDEESSTEYGESRADAELLVRTADSIRTFSEKVDKESAGIRDARDLLAKAKTVVFLGFGFGGQNMKLLDTSQSLVGRKSAVRRVFATAKDFSQDDREILQLKIFEMLGVEAQMRDTVRVEDVSCGELFRKFSQSITL